MLQCKQKKSFTAVHLNLLKIKTTEQYKTKYTVREI